MRRAVVVRGWLRGDQLIELEEPVSGVETEVEVVLRELEAAETSPPPDADARSGDPTDEEPGDRDTPVEPFEAVSGDGNTEPPA